MNGYTLPAVVVALVSVIAGVIADNVEPVLTFIGGGAATGVALTNAYLLSFTNEPDFAKGTALGGVAGAIIGAGLLLVDALVGG